jgi:hypothetical protein
VLAAVSKPSPEMFLWGFSFPCSRNRVGYLPVGLLYRWVFWGHRWCLWRPILFSWRGMAAGHHLLERLAFKVHILLCGD